MKTVFIEANENQLVFCRVSPCCKAYGKQHYPIWVFYPDGSFSRQEESVSYFRSKPNRLKKPYWEYTINELSDIANNKQALDV